MLAIKGYSDGEKIVPLNPHERLPRGEAIIVQTQRLSFTREVMETFGQVKADLKRRGQIIGDFDILIASFALAHGCTLLTNNLRHFGRITGLQIENWG